VEAIGFAAARSAIATPNRISNRQPLLTASLLIIKFCKEIACFV